MILFWKYYRGCCVDCAGEMQSMSAVSVQKYLSVRQDELQFMDARVEGKIFNNKQFLNFLFH